MSFELIPSIEGADIKRLDITEYGTTHLYRQLANIPQNEIAATFQNAVAEIIRVLDCPKGLVRYLQGSLPSIISRVKTAVRDQTLNRIFVLPSFPENKPKIIMSFGKKMDDEQYRKIIDKIGQCRFASDKLAIIKNP